MSAEILRMERLCIDAQAEHGGPARRIVDSVNLVLDRGEVLGLIGESGTGKSTIALAALGYVRPGCTIAGGRVLFGGTDLRTLSSEQRRQLRGRRIAYIAQSAAAAFDPAKRLYSQVCEAPIRHGMMGRDEARAQAVQLFRELDLPAPATFGERYPHQVSGGQLQRAMVAMAMSCQPEILVLDEPTTALDVTTQIEVLAAIRNTIRKHHTAGLYITHDLAVVAQVAHRIMVLRDGKVIEEGRAEQILHQPKMDYTRALVSLYQTRSRKHHPSPVDREPILKLTDLGASYAKLTRVIDDINLSVGPGETVAVVGESGSGKSTLARVITGLLPREKGEIRFRNAVLPPALAERGPDVLRRIQMIYQMPDIALNPRHTVGEIIGRPLSFYLGTDGAKRERRIIELLHSIDLPPEFAHRLPGELSGGQKQRICIARALAAEPDLVICDEVTSALDPLVADGILNLLGQLQREHGCAYLFITHDLGIVRRMADKVAVMFKGRIVAQGPVENVFAPPYQPYTELLLSSVPEMRLDWLDGVLAGRARARATVAVA
ncbi:MAG: ABC transporter ATP-binding protein [Hyphomicrobiales bacterium]|nr:ABC transporter ATP-binding protein [Hyphomicrobiales bacterium]